MNIYIGNIAKDVTEEELKEQFLAFGDVSSCVIIKDKFTGESRGFGFVEMPSKEQAQKAISLLNGKDLKGRPLTVNEARPRNNDRNRNRDRNRWGKRRRSNTHRFNLW
jgi:RNA recognition motif-containing protein